MASPLKKQQRQQIILAAIIALTLPCYGLGLLFVSIDRRGESTPTPALAGTDTITPSPFVVNSATPIVPTRFPTFTPSLTPTETLTPTPSPTSSPTPSETPSPQPSDTPSATASATQTVTDTPQPSSTPVPPTITPTGE
ncbi:MAG: hypothetical protein ACK2TT_06130 [Anaerolineales bacterium]